MKFVPPDTCLEDYERRRSAFLKAIAKREPDLKRRIVFIKEWFDRNSPYDSYEKARNLLRAICGDERH